MCQSSGRYRSPSLAVVQLDGIEFNGNPNSVPDPYCLKVGLASPTGDTVLVFSKI